MEEFLEKTLHSEEKYRGKIVRVKVDRVELPGGKESRREVVEHPGAVAVVAEEQNKLILLRQFRYPAGETLLEIPAGKLEKGEDPEDCARREMAEETGYHPTHLKLLCKFFSSPGFSDEVIYLYRAIGLVKKGEGEGEGEENLQAVLLDREEALQMVWKGEIRDAKTIIAVLWLCQRA